MPDVEFIKLIFLFKALPPLFLSALGGGSLDFEDESTALGISELVL
jgi:hypothetical protein